MKLSWIGDLSLAVVGNGPRRHRRLSLGLTAVALETYAERAIFLKMLEVDPTPIVGMPVAKPAAPAGKSPNVASEQHKPHEKAVQPLL
jgi:hypothetical protein